jgi:putative transposase
MQRKAYPSDLTDSQWLLIEPLIPAAWPGGRPRKHPMREVVNALLYVLRQGCVWRALPHDFPPWKTVYNYFAWFRADGTYDALLTALRRRVRREAGREPTPSAACIDSQSVKTAGGGEAVGTDGGKKVRGRKRHVVTDTMGLLLAVVVTAANADDGTAAPLVLGRMPAEQFPRLQLVWGDAKYRNDGLDAWAAENRPGLRVEVSSKPDGRPGFVPVKKRWVVEQSFGCLGRARRLSKDYERRAENSESMVKLSAILRMARRLKPAPRKWSERFRFKRLRRAAVAA